MSFISTSDLVKFDQNFATDVEAGLSLDPKKLSSKYFYDKKGDELFQAIMRMPEYYLTDCEYSILNRQKADILEAIGPSGFELIELGAGDGYKTKVLLEHFLSREVPFVYRPVDISQNVLEVLRNDLKNRWPDLAVRPLKGDYFAMLERLQSEQGQRKVVLFLGANIGNYTRQEALRFLENLHKQLDPGDQLLIGFDLKKDPSVILNAYNDPAGITAAFNLNLLTRINRELGGHFDLEEFSHWETYQPITGEAKSYLISRKEQEVEIEAIGKTFHFGAWEAIDVELSLKYSPFEIEALARAAGFQVVEHFYDDRSYFLDSLWEVK
ncbi:L-histidine N(alpha)-methyltransferase [Flavilitoribacter nigricans]|uniref:L-histidine N(Alpha)-methyltransferase n=1 Tax=Flavilitoribacter nigricans (strain ATCC 23147 / DSM 23189 / NBRC 102662 / NCIMB 1420 / SS-2) TaxID=1122177 RepID=A0A2D0N4I4_FLAN2|nr:L-histidine N(alpha)-methyltransferase [Flavilitoribacter nigricans]PHN03296.1 L-histidine N(alpha)-methyltransferase [Flavilitoribacter nigricans DSM 23189 = NBRC 102662]